MVVIVYVNCGILIAVYVSRMRWHPRRRRHALQPTEHQCLPPPVIVHRTRTSSRSSTGDDATRRGWSLDGYWTATRCQRSAGV